LVFVDSGGGCGARCGSPSREEGFNDNSFAVLDERSAVDKTILIVIWWNEFPKEEIKDSQPAMEVWIPTGWHSIRVKFEDAPLVCTGIEFNDAYYLLERQGPENFTSNGVLNEV
jgi:hypothetical protein